MKIASDRICTMLAILVLLMVPISPNLFGQSEINQKLFQAVYAGDTLGVNELFLQGADPNFVYEGQAILFYALEGQDLEMVKILYSRGADLNKRNRERLSPLEFSLQTLENDDLEYPEIARYLINNGASLKTKGKSTLLHRAADNDYPGSIVQALIENGVDIDAKNKEKKTALFYAMIYDSEEAALVLSRYGASLDFTLELDVDVSPLTYALVTMESDELTESFVRHGADFNHRDENYLSPFDLAVERGFYGTVGAMLQEGADPDRLVDDLPLLSYVMKTEEIETFDDTLLFSLIEQGANVNVDYRGETLASYLIHVSYRYRLDSIVFWNCNSEELIVATLDVLLSKAASNADVKTVKQTLSLGATVNPDPEFEPPLYSAVWGGSYEVVEVLVKAGADLSGRDYSGYTPLHDICEVLLELANADGHIPPGWYPKINPEELRLFPEKTCRLLVAHGVDVNAKDAEGRTALMRVKKRFPEFAQLLIELGAVEL